jgi:hypothetical protein
MIPHNCCNTIWSNATWCHSWFRIYTQQSAILYITWHNISPVRIWLHLTHHLTLPRLTLSYLASFRTASPLFWTQHSRVTHNSYRCCSTRELKWITLIKWAADIDIDTDIDTGAEWYLHWYLYSCVCNELGGGRSVNIAHTLCCSSYDGCQSHYITFYRIILHPVASRHVTLNRIISISIVWISAVTVVNSVHTIVLFSSYQDGWTALLCAANKGHATVVTELLKRGADINRSDEVRYCCTVAWTWNSTHEHLFIMKLHELINVR